LDEVCELGGRQATVVGEAFSFEYASIDVIAEGAEVAHVRQPPSKSKIVRVIEGGLGAQCALLLEILLDLTALIRDVEARVHPRRDHRGREAARRSPSDPSRKEQLHVIRAVQV
jgi:hypothetical protein